MKNLKLFSLFFCFATVQLLKAQTPVIGNPPAWNWVQTIGGSNEDIGRSAVADVSGNAFVAGSFSGNTQFGSTTFSATGFSNGFLAKFDPDGNVVWKVQFKSSSVDGIVHAQGVAIDPSGNILVIGNFADGSLKVGNQTYVNSGFTDLFVAKYSANGTLLWLEVMSAFDDLTGIKVLTDADGSAFILSNYSLTHISSTGLIDWSRNHDAGMESDVALYGNSLYFFGGFYQQIFLDAVTLNAPFKGLFKTRVNKSTGAYANALVLATNPNGNSLVLKSVSMINETDYFVSGTFIGEMDMGTFHLTGTPSSYQFFVGKIQADNCVWATLSEVQSPSYILDGKVFTDASGDAHLVGNVIGTITFGGSSVVSKKGAFWAEFNGDNGNVLSMSEQRFFVDAWYNNSGLYLTGTDLYDAFVQRISVNGSTVLYNNELPSNSGYGATSSIKKGADGLFVLSNYIGTTTFIDQISIDSIPSISVAKVSFNGNTMLWQSRIKGPSAILTYGHSLWLDQTRGKMYLIGHYNRPFKFGAEQVDTLGGMGQFVAQMGVDGSFGWIRPLPDNLVLHSVITDNNGQVLINGTFTNTIQLGSTQLSSAGENDIFWAKIDLNGQIIQAQRMGGEFDEYETYAGMDAQNNFYISGTYLSENIDFNGTHQTSTLPGDGNVFYVKFAPNGQVVWFKGLGSSDQPEGEDYFDTSSVTVDQAGNSYLAGYHGKSNFIGQVHLTSPYFNNDFVTKIDQNGNVLWAKSIKTKRISFNFCEIGLDNNGDCYIGAQFRDSIFFDGTAIAKIGDFSAYNAHITKLDGDDGSVKWVKTLSGSKNAKVAPVSLAVAGNDNLFVGGYLNDRLSFDGQSIHTAGGRRGFVGLIGAPVMVSSHQPTPATFIVSVSPNPFIDAVYISADPSAMDGAVLEVYNSAGIYVAKKQLGTFSGQTTMDLSEQPAGTYFLKVTTKTGEEILRLVKL